jgi:Protein NO VEIN, C-terminal
LDTERQKEVVGTPWSEAEVSAVVDSYFRMLASERAGVSYSKSESRRRLMTTVRRSEGSIERKLQNISAVLDLLGVQWINGYKPLAHYQDALVEAVERTLGREPRFLDPGSVGAPPPAHEPAILVAPPPFADPDETLTPAVRRLVGKFDPAERDARNRDLGKAGEKFVVDFERDRLRRAGRDDLAGDVRWVSDLDGDGYGYDVRSFESDGQERLLEIKTTCGHERTAFWLTRREVDVAAEKSGIYRIRRIFHFRNRAQMFDIAPPLHDRLLMTPTTFLAAPK